MNQTLRDFLIFTAGLAVAVGAEQMAEHRLAMKAAAQHKGPTVEDARDHGGDAADGDDAPAPRPRRARRHRTKRGERLAKGGGVSDDRGPDAPGDQLAELPAGAQREADLAEERPAHGRHTKADTRADATDGYNAAAKGGADGYNAAAAAADAPTPPPRVVINGELRDGSLWTDASFATANLDVPVDMKGLRGLAGSDRWWPVVYTAPAGSPTQRVTFFGRQHVTPQTIHMNLGQLGLHASSLGTATLDLRATALLTNAAGKTVTGKAGQAPIDRILVKLHSLRTFGSEPVTLLLPAARAKAQTGPWFTVPDQLTEGTAAVAVTLQHGDDLGKLASLLRRVPDFAVVPAARVGGSGLIWLRRGHVVASVGKGELSTADAQLIAGAVGATFAYRGPASAFVADLGVSTDALAARLRSANLPETVYVYSPGSRPFTPVKTSILDTGDALNMVKQNGTALFTQPVEVVALPAH